MEIGSGPFFITNKMREENQNERRIPDDEIKTTKLTRWNASKLWGGGTLQTPSEPGMVSLQIFLLVIYSENFLLHSVPILEVAVCFE